MIKILQDENIKEKKEETPKDKQANKVIASFRKQEEEEIASAYAAEINIPYIDTNIIPISVDDIRLLPEEEARKFETVVIHQAGKLTTLAATDPAKKETKDFIESLQSERGWQIRIFVISRSNFTRIFER
jgi:glutamate synthase domain-containing protein 1